MKNKIENYLEKELKDCIRYLDRQYSLNKISPLLFKNIKDFVIRKGKRVRPILFLVGYLGFAKKPAPNLYRTALAYELLHDFMLIHDDIIDKSDTRRGKLTLHRMLDEYLKRYRDIKFDGRDLAIVAGDIMYAMAAGAFLSIKENMVRKEKALRRFINAAVYTATGEFIELLWGIRDIEKITKEDIYKIYEYKTAQYTFASPLSSGAILAGARKNQVDKLYKYGICLGEAFQIKDDILGTFGESKKTGKSPLTDLQEAKKTILIWYAYKHSNRKNKSMIKKIFSKEKVNRGDLLKVRRIIKETGALDYARDEIDSFFKKAQTIIKSSRLRKNYKTFLLNYSSKLLSL